MNPLNRCDCPASVRTAPETVIEEAARLVSSDRETEHGDFADNAYCASQILYAIGVRVGVEEIPLVLLALKLARHAARPESRDNLVDAIGYLGLYARLMGHDPTTAEG